MALTVSFLTSMGKFKAKRKPQKQDPDTGRVYPFFSLDIQMEIKVQTKRLPPGREALTRFPKESWTSEALTEKGHLHRLLLG